MRIVILLLFIPSIAFTKGVDWEKLNKEMEYLRNNAFIDKEQVEAKKTKEQKETKAETKLAEASKEKLVEKKTYSLKRKPKDLKQLDPNVLPLEQLYFDQVKLKYSAPVRSKKTQRADDYQPKSKEEIKNSINTPSIPSLDF